jgi:hypothetical protein
LEAFTEAKQKADAAGKRMKRQDINDEEPSATVPVRVKEEDIGRSAGPSRTPTMININSDSSFFDWDED